MNKFLYRRGGAEAYMEDSADLLRAAGHDVSFFGMQHPQNTHLEHQDNLPSEVQLEPVPAGLRAKLSATGRMFWSQEASRGMARTLDEFRPDLVHVHNIYHQLSPSVLRPIRDRGIPVVMTLHDYKLACPSYLFLDKGAVCEACIGGHFSHAVRRRCKDGSLLQSTLLAAELTTHTRLGLYDPVTLFVCPSRFMYSKMTEARVYPDRLRLLHNFVDLTAVVPAAEPGPVVYAGRLSQEKGVDVLVRAAALLPTGTQVVIAGDGPLRSHLEQLAQDIAPGRVLFTGLLSKSEVGHLIASAVVVAAPSRCYENQPLAVLEAFAAGVPVAGSALGGIRELVLDGKTGALVAPDDAEGLAAAITRISTSPAKGRVWGARGRKLVEDEYSAAGHLFGLEALYAEALTLT